MAVETSNGRSLRSKVEERAAGLLVQRPIRLLVMHHTNRIEAAPLPPSPDSAILRLARALARQAAREDHERELAERTKQDCKQGLH
jgi:hypothetical protein